jgi:hypothetical protein
VLRAWALLGLSALVTGLLLVRAVRTAPCAAALHELPEPAGWRAWPVLGGLAGYTVVDLDPPHQSGCTSWRPQGLGDARLAGPHVCAERGVRLQSWFERWDSYRRVPAELAVRRDPKGDSFVVAGQMDRHESQPHGEEVFVVAFRPVSEGALGFLLRVALLPGLGFLGLAASARRLRSLRH